MRKVYCFYKKQLPIDLENSTVKAYWQPFILRIIVNLALSVELNLPNFYSNIFDDFKDDRWGSISREDLRSEQFNLRNVVLRDIAYRLIDNLWLSFAGVGLFEVDNDLYVVWVFIHIQSNCEWLACDFQLERKGALHENHVVQVNRLQHVYFLFLRLDIRQLLLVQLLYGFDCHFLVIS